MTNLADSGPGSFRAAVEEANRLAPSARPDRRIEINFDAGLAGRTVGIQGTFEVLFADYVTIQVNGSPTVPVTLGMPESFVASGDDLLFRDVSFQRPAAGEGLGDNVILVGCRRPRFERCVFENAPIAGLFLVGSPDATLAACTFRNHVPGRSGQGFLSIDGSDRMIVEDCLFDLAGRGLAFATVAGSRVRRCTFRNVNCAVMVTENCLDTEIGPDNVVENATGVGFLADLAGPRGPNEVGLRIFRNVLRDGSTVGIRVANRCWNVVLEDNLLERNGRGGQVQVMLEDAAGATVRNNRILAGFGAGLAVIGGNDVDVHSGNVIDGNAGEGVIVANGAHDVWIGPRDPAGPDLGNTIRNNGGLAVRITAASRCFVTGNTVRSGGRTLLQGNAGPIVVGQSSMCDVGPGLDIAGGASVAMEVTQGSSRVRFVDVTAAGYRDSGLRVASSSDVLVRDCRLQGGGTATYGVQMFDSSPVALFGNSVEGHTYGFAFNGCADAFVGPGNRAVRNGQFGFTFHRGGAASPSAIVQSSLAINQAGSGAGIAFEDVSGAVVNATCAGNHHGIQVAGSGSVRVVNSIFWANRGRDRLAGVGASAAMERSIYSSSQGTWQGGQGNSTGNPNLVNLGADDVRLQSTSPAIDSGDVFGVDLPTADAGGAQRVVGRSVDRGAYERPGLPTALTLVGPVQRDRTSNTFVFDLDAGSSRGGQDRLLLAGFSGTAPGLALSGAVLPLQPDVLTTTWIRIPFAWGRLDGVGRERATFTLPLPIMAVLPPELTFAFTLLPATDWASNPVVVRLW